MQTRLYGWMHNPYANATIELSSPCYVIRQTAVTANYELSYSARRAMNERLGHAINRKM